MRLSPALDDHTRPGHLSPGYLLAGVAACLAFGSAVLSGHADTVGVARRVNPWRARHVDTTL
jgi:hypothetical protein